jgi:hypothetical protein
VEGDAVQIVNVMKVKEGNLSRYGQLLEDTTREACSAGKFVMLDEKHVLLFIAKVTNKQVGDKVGLEEIPNCSYDIVLLEQNN